MPWRTLTRLIPLRRGLIVLAHVALVVAAYFGAYALRYNFHLTIDDLRRPVDTLPYLLAIRLFLFHRFGLFRGYWRHVGTRDLLHLIAAVTLGSVAFVVVLAATDHLAGLAAVVPVLDWLLLIALAGGVRFAARCFREEPHRHPTTGKRTLVIGAGQAGEQLVRQILHDPQHPLQVVGLVDDDPASHGRALHGVPVVGGSDDLKRLVAIHHADYLVIAIPSAAVEVTRRLVARCAETGVEFKILPPLHDLVTSPTVQLSQCREVRIEDLLGREPVRLDVEAVGPDIAGKVVLVTGAGGSIGSELARQIARFHPRRLLLLERAESPLYFIHLEVSEANPETDVVPVLASVTNADRLTRLFETYQPEVVFHAAAYKHVPLLEWNIMEGVWNNVVGTLRVAQCAARAGTGKFVLISTDKAVNPASILGATKRIAERIVRALPSLRSSATDFRVVRFGNVLGSDGSVVPLFQKQIEAGGPITVTHPEVRRYFMTIPEAVQLVLEAAALPEAAGRIALLEMGTQVRILDLAEQLIRLSGLAPYQDIQIVFTGMRPGEKLLEELVAPHETTGATSVDKIRVVESNGDHGVELARRLRSLIAVTARGDESAMLRALTALVPDYQPEPLVSILRRTGSLGARRRNGHARRPVARPPLALTPASEPPLRDGTNDRA